MVLIDRINPTVTLASSLVLYPLLFHLVTPRKASPSRFVQSREAISVAHCVLLTAASLLELYRQRDKWVPPTDHGTVTRATDPMRTETGLDIIDLRSPVGNAIVAWECGYLLQDFLVLIVGARQAAGDRQSRTLLAKNVNWRVLGWHHLGVGGALLLFHLRASRGEAKGVLVVLMMFLMNISTPFGTLHWYLKKFRPTYPRAIALAHVAYLATYGLCRVHLLYWILHVYGLWVDRSALAALASLPWSCQLGIGLIGTTNTLWLLMGMRKVIKQYAP